MTQEQQANTAQAGQNQAGEEQAVSGGTAYEVIRKRLSEQGNALESAVNQTNQQRIDEFGSTDLKVVGRTRVRTENNCVARDIVRVGEHLLFGYNVFIGLKSAVQISDVFSLYKLEQLDEAPEMTPVELAGSFLGDARFVSDFNELYTYYKNTFLTQLQVKDGKLLAAFQIGERETDIRVFRWTLSADGKQVDYLDNRGERDIALPPGYDFEWLVAGREQVIDGRHPHVNILDTIFVDTVGGDLTIKVENNTKTGKGIYEEAVEDPNQSLDDADFFYAELGQLILLKIKPYQEERWRYLVYNRLNESVVRIDAVGESCQQLPDDHGIVFPGGYYLQTGSYKTFDEPHKNMRFKRSIRSPNGEDILFAFYQPIDGVVALYPYNMIEKTLRSPLYAHGYGLFEDGQMVVFYADEEPTRVHPMQVWRTPFFSDVYASQSTQSQTFFGAIGNADLVRGISDLFTVVQLIRSEDANAAHFHELCRSAAKLFDQYHWLSAEQMQPIAGLLKNIIESGELVLDEYEKVTSIRKSSAESLAKATADIETFISRLQPDSWSTPQPFVDALVDIRTMRGHLLTIGNYRYIDQSRIAELNNQLGTQQNKLSGLIIDFLAAEDSLKPFYNELAELEKSVQSIDRKVDFEAPMERLNKLSTGLELLTETVNSIASAEANTRTQIIESISTLFAHLNQAKARAQNKLKSLGYNEARAQFAAQFKLLSQSMTSGLAMANSPDRCDDQLSKLMNQLQDLESQFGEYDEFLGDILEKREEIFESFESHKQKLLDERQQRAQTLFDAAERIVDGVRKRSEKFRTEDELNSFFAADPLLQKLNQLAAQMRELGDSVKADEVDSLLKAVKDQAVRSLRDKSDLYDDDGSVIRLGPRHRFSVNTRELDLTLLPRGDELYFHLTGTNFYEAIEDEVLSQSQSYWALSRVSESAQVSRAEYLAYSVLVSAQRGEHNLDWSSLVQAKNKLSDLQELVWKYAEPRYKEGYERGIHDHDAALILEALLPVYEMADLLRFDPLARARACVFWAEHKEQEFTANWLIRSRSALQMQTLFSSDSALAELQAEAQAALLERLQLQCPEQNQLESLAQRAGEYLIYELAKPISEFVTTRASSDLHQLLMRELKNAGAQSVFEETLASLSGNSGKQWRYVEGWFVACLKQQNKPHLQPYIPEAVATVLAGSALSWKPRELKLEIAVEGLLSDHEQIHNGRISMRLDEFLLRLQHHQQIVVPGYLAYLNQRHHRLEQEKAKLRLDQFKPRPLTSFVRNKLINQSYLALIGDNLAKQMGTVGENKRTDLMGLLMMISPPGYGKTTLMEYIAHRLGLIFMKINCPSLGHEVDSLDPAQAPNATARQELDKLNLGLEMGNNVMLYLDDIQHTNPEFLQKFISLCDGTRRIEGVWKGETKTYDMRGKKFCVVMAGNPYTESGELFKIPDMLANRADIYNLGDVLSGTEEIFALSYIENSMTSNAVLAPLATRDMNDFYRFVERAKGRSVSESDFSHAYSAAEGKEIVETLRKLFSVQNVVLRVNQQYIESAAQDDRYRTEPPFKLQGSYRNMNKIAEKISSVMTDKELQTLLDDHYLGEAQLLTSGTEANLLKLRELRGLLSATETERWQTIKREYCRLKEVGGADSDVGARVVSQLNAIAASLQSATSVLTNDTAPDWTEKLLNGVLQNQAASHAVIEQTLQGLSKAITEINYQVEVVNQPLPGLDLILQSLASTLEHSIYPLVKAMDGKIDLDLKTHDRMKQLLIKLQEIDTNLMQSVQSVRKDSRSPRPEGHD